VEDRVDRRGDCLRWRVDDVAYRVANDLRSADLLESLVRRPEARWNDWFRLESGSPPLYLYLTGLPFARLSVKWIGSRFSIAFFCFGVTGRVTSGLGAGNEPFFDLTVFWGFAGAPTATSRGGTLT
jgi:hypothetical protein